MSSTLTITLIGDKFVWDFVPAREGDAIFISREVMNQVETAIKCTLPDGSSIRDFQQAFREHEEAKTPC